MSQKKPRFLEFRLDQPYRNFPVGPPSQLYMLLYMAQLFFSLCNTWKDPVHIFGMVGLTSAFVWPRDLLKYHGIRRRQGWQGHSTLRAIESICRNVPTTLEHWFTGALQDLFSSRFKKNKNNINSLCMIASMQCRPTHGRVVPMNVQTAILTK